MKLDNVCFRMVRKINKIIRNLLCYVYMFVVEIFLDPQITQQKLIASYLEAPLKKLPKTSNLNI